MPTGLRLSRLRMGSLLNKNTPNQHSPDRRDESRSRKPGRSSSGRRLKKGRGESIIYRNVSKNHSSRSDRLRDDHSNGRKRTNSRRTVRSGHVQDSLTTLDSDASCGYVRNSSKRMKYAARRSPQRRKCNRLNRKRRCVAYRRRPVRGSRKMRRPTRNKTSRKARKTTKRGKCSARQCKRKKVKHETLHRRHVLKPDLSMKRDTEYMFTPQEHIITKNLDRGFDDIRDDPLNANQLCRSLVRNIPGVPADGRKNAIAQKNTKRKLGRDKEKKCRKYNKGKRSYKRKLLKRKPVMQRYNRGRKERKKNNSTLRRGRTIIRRPRSPRYILAQGYKRLSKMAKKVNTKNQSSNNRSKQAKRGPYRGSNHNNQWRYHHYLHRMFPRCPVCNGAAKSRSEACRLHDRFCYLCRRLCSQKSKSYPDTRSQNSMSYDDIFSRSSSRCAVRRTQYSKKRYTRGQYSEASNQNSNKCTNSCSQKSKKCAKKHSQNSKKYCGTRNQRQSKTQKKSQKSVKTRTRDRKKK